MRMPRVRFTVRAMMVAVAVASIPLGMLFTRHHRYSRTAAEHRSRMIHSFAIDTNLDARNGIVTEEGHQWHKALAAKYEHAACYPWLPVEPDPPEPEW